ncbi:anti-sigma factor domain-containing protein [Limnobacter sp.]|uniref:anti-sigma factor n=1 Tax=Limnobacter sp. TaxID=2003368 RepID=UPI003514EB2A
MTESQADAKVVEAGEYVLGVMSDAERQEFERRMAQDPELAAEVRQWTEHFAAMSRKLEQQPVSPTVWQRVSQSLDRQSPPPNHSSSQGTWAWLWKGWAVAASAAVLVLAMQVGQQAATEQAGPRYVAVMKSPDKSSEWLVEARPKGMLRVYQIGGLPIEGDPSAMGKSLQFWTKAPGDATPTSLGFVKLGEPLELPADVLHKLVDQQLFEVTLEPEQGSPYGNRPSGPVMFIGSAVALAK